LSKMAHALSQHLSDLRGVIMERLLTTPLEVLQRKEFLQDVEANTGNIDEAFAKMQQELTELAMEAEQQVRFTMPPPNESGSVTITT